jgi:hypothetical protein
VDLDEVGAAAHFTLDFRVVVDHFGGEFLLESPITDAMANMAAHNAERLQAVDEVQVATGLMI